MANLEQIAKLDAGTEAWNQWRKSCAATPDFSDADFSGKDLSRADLRGAGFRGADLRGASLREANLQGADLKSAFGLKIEQLAGADLTGATLPEHLKELYDRLESVDKISESSRKLFLGVLAACCYSWLTIASTTDLNLIFNRASTPLPVIQASIPIVGFYVVAPLLVLGFYFYFHFYLQKLWEELGSLPAILPDGRPLHSRVDPWLLNDLVRSSLPMLNVNRPFLSYFQGWISVITAWWTVPLTILLFWGRYLRRQDRVITTFHVVLLTVAVIAALQLYRLADATLRGVARRPFGWKSMLTSRRSYLTAALTIAIGILFGVVSWGARWGVPSYEAGAPDVLTVSKPGHYEHDLRPFPGGSESGPLTWVPRLMALVGYSPFADLTGSEISRKKSTWTQNHYDKDSIVGAELSGANLRYASISDSFLAEANLEDADLRGANLMRTDLRGANLVGAHMCGANLFKADLRGAKLEATYLTFHDVSGGEDVVVPENRTDLRNADLRMVNLSRAHLYGVDLSGAMLNQADLTYSDFRHDVFFESYLIYRYKQPYLDPLTLKSALHWEKAFYEGETLKALGLPADHNSQLAEQGASESELPQKSKLP